MQNILGAIMNILTAMETWRPEFLQVRLYAYRNNAKDHSSNCGYESVYRSHDRVLLLTPSSVKKVVYNGSDFTCSREIVCVNMQSVSE
jgi:hypothetical protein